MDEWTDSRWKIDLQCHNMLEAGVILIAFLIYIWYLMGNAKYKKHVQYCTGLEVIKLEYSLKLKIKRNDWLLVDMCPPIIALYFEFENKLKFYNLKTRFHILFILHCSHTLFIYKVMQNRKYNFCTMYICKS